MENAAESAKALERSLASKLNIFSLGWRRGAKAKEMAGIYMYKE
jgi:hypothetical protein